jgi:hypothetical protein
MLNVYAAEVLSVGGKALLKLADQEFANGFRIIARTPDYIVLGDKEKNVSFSRGSKSKIIERFFFDKARILQRK